MEVMSQISHHAFYATEQQWQMMGKHIQTNVSTTIVVLSLDAVLGF